MIKKWLSYLFLILLSIQLVNAQKSLKQIVDKYNDHSIPYLKVEELGSKKDALILDARELCEYKVSHIDSAIYVGYKEFDIKNVTTKIKDKKQLIVVYCSLGVRSEQIAKKIKKAGYTNVYNLYGGIFDWKNKGYKVFDSNHLETENVHAFDKEWGKWLKKGNRVYGK